MAYLCLKSYLGSTRKCGPLRIEDHNAGHRIVPLLNVPVPTPLENDFF